MGILTLPQTYDPSENDEPSDIIIPVINKNVKKSSRNTYYSDVVGELIKNAVTGATYPWKVGSKEEEKFFRVITASNGNHKAYYDSPKCYMEHHKCVLDDSLIKKWEINHTKI
tara:strand:+ start:333 stop:671 length:339 start_codon:yes stop_codon:yes gene_type:complete